MQLGPVRNGRRNKNEMSNAAQASVVPKNLVASFVRWSDVPKELRVASVS